MIRISDDNLYPLRGRKADRAHGRGVALAEQSGAQKSGGYTAETPGMDSAAKLLQQCHQDINAATRELQGRIDATALGDVRDAWTRFLDAWVGKAETTQKMITFLAGKISSSAATYKKTEQQTEATVQNSGGGKPQ